MQPVPHFDLFFQDSARSYHLIRSFRTFNSKTLQLWLMPSWQLSWLAYLKRGRRTDLRCVSLEMTGREKGQNGEKNTDKTDWKVLSRWSLLIALDFQLLACSGVLLAKFYSESEKQKSLGKQKKCHSHPCAVITASVAGSGGRWSSHLFGHPLRGITGNALVFLERSFLSRLSFSCALRATSVCQTSDSFQKNLLTEPVIGANGKTCSCFFF